MIRNILASIVCILFSLTGNAQTVGLFQNDSLAFNGYTLFAPNGSMLTYLIDNCGNLVNSWQASNAPGLSAYLLEDGSLLRTTRVQSNFGAGGTGGRMERYNWDGTLAWSYTHSTPDYHQHHDIEPLPNGNILILAWEAHSQNESVNYGRDPSLVGGGGIWLEQIVEIEPVGQGGANIVWEWHLLDHLIQDFDETKPNYGVVADHPELMDFNYSPSNGPGLNPDWIHANSISYNPVFDQIILSSRTMSEIWVIDHSTTTAEAASHSGGLSGKGGDFLYRWGNPEVYDHGTSDEKQLFGQHHVTWIPEGYPNEGKILLFNNGINRPGGNRSTVDIIAPPVDANGNYTYVADQAYGPDTLWWSYGNDLQYFFYSSNISGALAMPNGNVLICDGNNGHFFEVDLEGNFRWDYISPVNGNGPITQGNPPGGNSVFRALRYGPDYPGFVGKDLTPGDPIELNPLPSDCVIYDGMVTGVSDVTRLEGAWVKGNLISSDLFLENHTGGPVYFEVVDLSGRTITKQTTYKITTQINLNGLGSGLYIVRLMNSDKTKSIIEKIVKW